MNALEALNAMKGAPLREMVSNNGHYYRWRTGLGLSLLVGLFPQEWLISGLLEGDVSFAWADEAEGVNEENLTNAVRWSNSEDELA